MPASLLLLLALTASAADPTVVCDGSGGYRPEIYGREGTLLAPCFEAHERVHVEDLRSACPEGCRGQPNGAAHGTGDPRCPRFRETETYLSWLKATECVGYAAEARCLRRMAEMIDAAPASRARDVLEAAVERLRAREREVTGYRATWGCDAVSATTSPASR